ncbi:MAG: long-chain fatty acid--CoA ligase, partial [Actinobacteria bacterium]|nr:long-chain fatty acid--CoA ligase [Actinomycetota bacterium]
MSQEHHLARQGERHLEEVGRDRESLSYEGRWFTGGELFDRAARIAGGLRERGVAPGDRVVAVMANSPDVGILYSALWRAGAVATPAMFLLPPTELRHILTDAGARMVVVSPEFLGNVQAAAEGLDVAIVVDATTASSAAPLLDAGEHGLPTLDDLAGADPSDIVDRDDDDLAALMYTGGTTGRSKGVKLTHANLWYAGRAGHEATTEDGLKRTLMPLPLAHVFGLLVTSIGLHSDPDQVSVLMRWFEPNAVVSLIEEHR